MRRESRQPDRDRNAQLVVVAAQQRARLLAEAQNERELTAVRAERRVRHRDAHDAAMAMPAVPDMDREQRGEAGSAVAGDRRRAAQRQPHPPFAVGVQSRAHERGALAQRRHR